MHNLTKGRKPPDNGQIAQFKWSVIYCQKGHRAINVLRRVDKAVLGRFGISLAAE